METLQRAMFPYVDTIVYVDVMSLESYARVRIGAISEISEHIIVEPERKMISPITTILFANQIGCSLRKCYVFRNS